MINTPDPMAQASAALLAHAPFDAAVLRSMQIHYTTDDAVAPTAKTDCTRNAWFNTAWLSALPYRTIAFVMAHEARHKLFAHQTHHRLGDHAQLLNVAMDFCINNSLVQDGHTYDQLTPCSMQDVIDIAWQRRPPIEQGVMLDSTIKPEWGTRAVYEHLLARLPPPESGGQGQGTVLPGTFDEAASPQDGTSADTAQVDIDLAGAVAAAKAMGSLPKGIARTLNEIAKSRVDWREELRAFVVNASGFGDFAEDWTFRRTSRRWLGGPLLPRVVKPPIGEIVIGIDTSGSISTKELDLFAAQVRAIHEDVRPGATHIVWCDAAVAGTQTFTADEPIELMPKGGGGTAFKPVFDWVDKNVARPMALVMLTDGYGPFDFRSPDYPVLWTMTTDVVAPWGRTIRLD